MKTKRKTHSKQWQKRHGFSNGLWRLEERERLAKAAKAAKAAKERNAHVAQPFRSIINSFTPLIAE